MTDVATLPRASRIDALRRVYAAAEGEPGLFAFGTSEILAYVAAACAGGASPPWPSRAGRSNRLLRPLARSALARALARPALAAATLASRRRTTRPPRAGAGRTAPGRGCRALLAFPSANEERILAWRNGLRDLPTVRLEPGAPPDGESSEGPAGAGTTPAAHAALARSARGVASRLSHDLPVPALAAASRLAFLRRVPDWMRAWRALDALDARDPVREVLATTLDARTFAAAHWARGRADVEVHWVQHGFLSLDVLPWVPGARHHAYDASHAEVARACGAPDADLAPPIGLAYFPHGRYEPTRTILVASQGRLPFDLPVGRGVEGGYLEVVRRALASGWRVVQRPHRIETHDGFPRHALPGAEVTDGGGTFEAQVRALRPRYVLSVWSTAALDAAALGARPVFVASVEGMREHSQSDLSAYGEVLDPADAEFAAKVDRLLAVEGGA